MGRLAQITVKLHQHVGSEPFKVDIMCRCALPRYLMRSKAGTYTDKYVVN
jgi:hypothetical protein